MSDDALRRCCERSQVTAGAPWDVRAYRQRYPRFPNDSTVNQLYTDEKFEA